MEMRARDGGRKMQGKNENVLCACNEHRKKCKHYVIKHEHVLINND